MTNQLNKFKIAYKLGTKLEQSLFKKKMSTGRQQKNSRKTFKPSFEEAKKRMLLPRRREKIHKMLRSFQDTLISNRYTQNIKFKIFHLLLNEEITVDELNGSELGPLIMEFSQSDGPFAHIATSLRRKWFKMVQNEREQPHMPFRPGFMCIAFSQRKPEDDPQKLAKILIHVTEMKKLKADELSELTKEEAGECSTSLAVEVEPRKKKPKPLINIEFLIGDGSKVKTIKRKIWKLLHIPMDYLKVIRQGCEVNDDRLLREFISIPGQTFYIWRNDIK